MAIRKHREGREAQTAGVTVDHDWAERDVADDVAGVERDERDSEIPRRAQRIDEDCLVVAAERGPEHFADAGGIAVPFAPDFKHLESL